MKYEEFKALHQSLWEVKMAISSDSDGTLISNWESSHRIDDTIDLLQDAHPKMTAKYWRERNDIN